MLTEAGKDIKRYFYKLLAMYISKVTNWRSRCFILTLSHENCLCYGNQGMSCKRYFNFLHTNELRILSMSDDNIDNDDALILKFNCIELNSDCLSIDFYFNV